MKYQPSNGSEGEWFMSKFCDNCINQHPDPDHPKQCRIIGMTMCYNVNDKEYPEEWTYDEQDKPTCTKFVQWNWDQDDDGNWICPVIPPPDDPNQLCFPFILEEIGVTQIEPQPILS